MRPDGFQAFKELCTAKTTNAGKAFSLDFGVRMLQRPKSAGAAWCCSFAQASCLKSAVVWEPGCDKGGKGGVAANLLEIP